MTKKQIAVAVGAALTAIAGVLSQCTDETPVTTRQGVTVTAAPDAGAR